MTKGRCIGRPTFDPEWAGGHMERTMREQPNADALALAVLQRRYEKAVRFIRGVASAGLRKGGYKAARELLHELGEKL